MLQKAMDSIAEFHYKHQYPIGRSLEKECLASSKFASPLLWSIGTILIFLSKRFLKLAVKWMNKGDTRLYRSHLMVEELGETILAMAAIDEIAYADGLGDLTYVVLGSGVTHDIPLSEVFEEISFANLQKEPRNKNADPRLRNKGKNWQKPDIKGVLDAYHRRKR